MKILDLLTRRPQWELYYDHKMRQGNLSERDAKDLYSFIVNEEYLPLVRKIKQQCPFAPPKRKLIGKSGVKKKRVVYTYGREENYILKHIAFLLREYDGIFAPNLYSFRKDTGVKAAVSELLRIRDISRRYVYKVDISDYFNSVDTELLMPELCEVLEDDPELFGFIRSLLEDPEVESEDGIIIEKKGIMAGVPVSGFLADLYLRDMDRHFHEQGVPYMRYSDDIIVFARSMEELNGHIGFIKDTLAQRKLKINEAKEIITLPGQPWSFLGFSFDNGVIDICPVSLAKLKAKMRRKTRALARWAARKDVAGTVAARAFVKRFNAKLYDNPVCGELTWTRWFFPVINTDRSLAQIDRYMQECIRYLAMGTRTKARFNFRYEDIKALGYKSLVNEYYRQKNTE